MSKYIEKEKQEVTDSEILKSLQDKKEKGLDIPSNYTVDRVWDKKTQEYKTRFYHNDRFNYFKKHYDFYKTRILTEEEMRFLLESKKNVSMQSIASTLRFFKILVIVIIAISLFFSLISLMAAGAVL